MSTLQSTISMLEVLPEHDVQTVYIITRNLLEKREAIPFKPVTKADVLHDLSLSTRQIKEGKYSTVDAMVAEMRAKYGL